MTAAGPLTNVTQVVAGGSEFSLALLKDGTVWVWGANGSGQLGLGDQVDRTLATQVPALPFITKVAAGNYHSLAVTGDGHVYAWGYNGWGQLGNPAAGVNQTTPILMSELYGNTQITDATGGGNFTMLVRSVDEVVFTVGDNQMGQLAIGNTLQQNIPVASNY